MVPCGHHFCGHSNCLSSQMSECACCRQQIKGRREIGECSWLADIFEAMDPAGHSDEGKVLSVEASDISRALALVTGENIEPVFQAAEKVIVCFC